MKNYKYYIIGLYAMLSVNMLFAFPQNSLDQKAVDSIYKKGCNYIFSYPDSTLVVTKELYQRSQKEGFEYGRIKAKVMAGFHYINAFKLDTAEFILTSVIDSIQNRNQFKNEQGQAWYYLANAHFRQSKGALVYFDIAHALDIYLELGNIGMQGNCYFLLGKVERVLNQDLGTALQHFLKSYRLKTDAKESDVKLVGLMQNIVEVYADLGQYEKAIQQEHVMLKFDSLNEYKRCFILHTLGKHQQQIGQYDSSKYYLEKAEEIAKTEPSARRFLGPIYYSLAETHTELGNYKQSIQTLNSISENSAYNDRFHGLLARNHLGLQQFHFAIKYGRKAFFKALNADQPASIISSSALLANAYEAIQRPDSALIFYKKCHQLQDSIYTMDNQKKMSLLFAEMETIEKQQEIDQLSYENQLTMSKSEKLWILFWTGIAISILAIGIVILLFQNRKKKLQIQQFQLQKEIQQKVHDLGQQSVRMIQKTNSLSELEEGLKKIKKGLVNGQAQEIQHMLNTIRLNKVVDKEWDKFEEHFGSFNQQFMDNLGLKFPGLTVNEKRLSSLIKSGYNNREISELMNIEVKSVRMAKYRLKKKLGLEEDVNLTDFLLELERSEQVANT